MASRLARITAAFAILLAAAGCGQKGALFLPPPGGPAPTPPLASAPAPSAPASTPTR